jgi:hypothetical protein
MYGVLLHFKNANISRSPCAWPAASPFSAKNDKNPNWEGRNYKIEVEGPVRILERGRDKGKYLPLSLGRGLWAFVLVGGQIGVGLSRGRKRSGWAARKGCGDVEGPKLVRVEGESRRRGADLRKVRGEPNAWVRRQTPRPDFVVQKYNI